jgi:hypothetical protein
MFKFFSKPTVALFLISQASCAEYSCNSLSDGIVDQSSKENIQVTSISSSYILNNDPVSVKLGEAEARIKAKNQIKKHLKITTGGFIEKKSCIANNRIFVIIEVTSKSIQQAQSLKQNLD